MRLRRTLTLLPTIGLLAVLAPLQAAHPASAWTSGGQVDLGQWLSPDGTMSTSGDFATDTFSDPWDFNNVEDVNPYPQVGVFDSDGANYSNGVLTVATRDAAEIRLLMNWSQQTSVLPWGRDGWAHPIDSSRYTQTDFSIRADQTSNMSIRFWNTAGQPGVIPFQVVGGGWQTFHFDMLNRANYPFAGSDAQWAGPIVRFEIFRAPIAGNPPVNVQVDWVRLHTASSSRTPVANLPIPQVISPNQQGGADYATVERGNPWDFAGMDDVSATYGVTNLGINGNGDLTGTSVNNDPSIGLALGPTLNTDRYHRFTADVCYGGGMSFEDAPGGGMVGRVVWMPHNTLAWTETQDFVVFPGCNKVSFDMVTSPPGAINDEFSALPTGWRGVRVDQLRFDLNEDRGRRDFTLQNITLADDAAFSTSYPITFQDGANTPGAKADIYVTTTKGSYSGTKIASNLNVGNGVNTFNWNGNDVNGAVMPNATYWVYVVMKNASGNGVGYSTGPVRIEKPVPSAPSYYVPLTPSRLLDTRTGQGGNISPLSDQTFTELQVTGVGGVPQANVTAVVMNVTAVTPTGSGYITAWPSGEPQPLVSNINFVPGQTVPNLVTVKVGANGRVNLFNSAGSTHLLADVAGYYTTTPAPGGRFTAVTPARLLDTRSGTGTGGAINPLGQDQSLNLNVTGVGGVPASGVTAVALNVTVDQPTGTGYLTVWPAGEQRPLASTHNYVPGLTVANLVLAKVGANGQVSIYNSAGNTHVVADVIGYFSATGGTFVPVSPQRLIDTRNGTGGVAVMGAGDTRTLGMATNPVPGNATAVIVNVTSVNSTAPGYVTVWPTATGRPLASTLNPRPGVAVPNQAYLRVGASGGLDAFNANGSTDLIVDVFGYVLGG